MLSRPQPGTRVVLHYAAAKRPVAPHHGKTGTVEIVATGPGPRNHAVRLDTGEVVSVPAGQLRKANGPN